MIRREPVRAIGILAACIIAVITTLTGNGIISDALASRLSDIVHDAVGLATLAAPIIAAELARLHVTPVRAPQLVSGTAVTVTSSAGGSPRVSTV